MQRCFCNHISADILEELKKIFKRRVFGGIDFTNIETEQEAFDLLKVASQVIREMAWCHGPVIRVLACNMNSAAFGPKLRQKQLTAASY